MKQLLSSLVVVLLALFGAGAAPAADADNAAGEPVVLQLKWRHQFQFAGYYAAAARGYYRDAGLRVIIRERRPGMIIADELASGRAQFAVEMPGLLLERQRGKPVVVLAAIFQHSPEVLVALEKSGIRTPHDLIGKRVMLMPGGNFEIRAMLNHEGVRPGDLTIIDHSWKLGDLISGRADALSCYLTDAPFLLRQQGIAPTIIAPINYGIDFYGDCLYTTSNEISAHPERVKAFLAASLKGWQYAMEHPQEVIDLIIGHYGSHLSRDALKFEAEKTRELMLPRFIQIGHMNPGRWRRIADTFVELGMLGPDYSLQDFLYSPDQGEPRTVLKLILVVLAATVLLVIAVALLLLTFNLKLKKSVELRTVELAQSEQRFREIFNSTSDALFVHDPETGDIRDVNQTMLKMFRCTREEALTLPIGVFSEGKSPYGPAEAAHWMHRALTEGPQVFEWHARRRDGELFWVEVSLKKSNIAGQEALLASVRDITDRRQLETELRQAQKMEAIGTLAGGIAHDFNNILTAIFGYTELARIRAAGDAVLLDNLDKVRQGAVRARDLVRQILAFSRKAEQSKTTLQLADVVAEVISLLRSTIPASIEIRHSLRSRSPVHADETQMHQVVLNLCTNAYQAMEHGKGVLAIDLEDAVIDADQARPGGGPAPGRYVRLTVSDTGCGMDEETLGKIFEPYFTSKEQGKGTGLGLAVVHGIIRDCQGEIMVESTPGQGSTFTIYLPVHEPDNVRQGGESAEEVVCGGSGRIMVVDDEESIRELVSAFLGQAGYQVETFANGMEAWERLHRDPAAWDLLISDMNMPGMGGLELVRLARGVRDDLAVILCTGFSEELNEAEAAGRFGSVLFLQKPLTRDELMRAVCGILRQGPAPRQEPEDTDPA
ncbi:ABC transporter substrate-binding protein [Thermodesulfobacteriota bacterium B35]